MASFFGGSSQEEKDAPDEEGRTALLLARQTVRSVLASFHVLDALPERSRILAVDAELPVHQVLAVALREQHLQSPGQRARSGSGGSYHGEMRRQVSATGGSQPPPAREENSTQRQPLCCGVVAPSLPSNILAEVCEFEAFGPSSEETEGQVPAEEAAAEEPSISASFRRWTSPDDGWGKDPSIARQDLARMPMGMPVTVSEIAKFLIHACDGPPPPVEEPPVETSFWARARSEPASPSPGAEDGDIFDWTLSQWRGHCLKTCPKEEAPAEATLDGRWTGGCISGTMLIWNDGTTASLKILAPKKFTVKAGDQTLDAELEDDGKLHWADGEIWEKDTIGNKLQYEPFFMPQQRSIQFLTSLSFCSRKEGEGGDDAEIGAALEDLPLIPSPVLVHRVNSATPRPILCTDDTEASLLKAVTLLLAYPDLDAVPIVSPARCTVVAHLTLGYILAFVMGRLRGNELGGLRELLIGGGVEPGGSRLIQRAFSGEALEAGGEKIRWAESTQAEASRPPLWVLRKSQPTRDLLTFFASTTHNCVPIVEDGSDSSVGGGILGLLSRRDLLDFLDLATRCARRRATQDGISDDFEEAEPVTFDATAPVEVILNTLRRHRLQQASLGEDGAEGRRRQASDDAGAENAETEWFGAGLVYQQELTLRALVLQLLLADNRKLLFVEAAGESAPRIRRLISVADTWRLLIGDIDKIVEGHVRGAQVPGDNLPEGEAQA